MKRRVIIASIIIAALLVVVLNNACFRSAKPNEQKTIGIFTEEKENLIIVADYLKNLDYPSCFIGSDNGQLYAAFDYHEIDDISVVEAIKRLWEKGCTHISKNHEMNSISFELWYNDQDMACGMLTCIREDEDAKVQFMTEIKKLSTDWYYYVSDYNTWRTNNHN